MTADFKQGANLAGKVLGAGALASVGNQTLYTVPANRAAKIGTFSLTNWLSSTLPVTVYVMPTGQTLGANYQVLFYILAAYDVITQEDVLSMFKGMYLEAGASIGVNVGAANVANFTLTGVESY